MFALCPVWHRRRERRGQWPGSTSLTEGRSKTGALSNIEHLCMVLESNHRRAILSTDLEACLTLSLRVGA